MSGGMRTGLHRSGLAGARPDRIIKFQSLKDCIWSVEQVQKIHYVARVPEQMRLI